MTLQALRVKIGESAFDQLMREWYGKHRNGNASTEQFVALSEQISGQQLDNFFDVWLHNPDRPVSW
jgi:aminopeptidase N